MATHKMLRELAEYRKKILISAIVAVIITSGIAVSATWFASSSAPLGASIGNSSGDSLQSQLIVELTDPATVPEGTTSLNLTYSQIVLTAADSSGVSQSFSLIPGFGSTVNLLQLQNYSETLAMGELSTSFRVLSATLLVSRIAMEANGSSFVVALAPGGNTLSVDMVSPSQLNGTENALLLDLNPTIINTSTGYQFVPASVGIFKPQSEVTSQNAQTGSISELTNEDWGILHHAKGSITADLEAMSVSGAVTTLSIQVINSGKNPEKLELFTIHGDFDSVCSSSWNYENWRDRGNCGPGTNDVIFLPGEPHIASTMTAVTSCASRHISLVNSTDWENNLANPIVMNPGQCLMFSFSGTIQTGNHILIPDQSSGKEFVVHVFADKADSKIDCYFQRSSYPSCYVDNDEGGSD